jgi:protein-disulfide isomerase
MTENKPKKLSPTEVDGKEPVQDETKENIVAVSIFLLIVLIIAAIATQGFGLFPEKEVVDTQRYNVDFTGEPVKGNQENPKLIIIAFSDYQCPFCKEAEDNLKEAMKEYENEILFVFRDLPLESIHPHAKQAALATECADEQEAYWQYHDKLFENQKALKKENLISYAQELNLNSTIFEECLTEEKYTHKIEADKRIAKRLSIKSTPTFFFNGRKITGRKTVEEFTNIIKEEIQLVN